MRALFDEATDEPYDRRVQRVARELNKAIVTLRTATVRSGEVADGTEDEWLIRESIIVCRDNLSIQIESLTKLKRKIERAQESNPGRLALIDLRIWRNPASCRFFPRATLPRATDL